MKSRIPVKVSRYLDKDVSALMGSGAAVAMIIKQIQLHGGGGGAWGSITGTLSAQTDLQNALNLKANSASLATVATTGAYADLSGRPSLATVATSGLFTDLSSKPTTLAGYGITDATSNARSAISLTNTTGTISTYNSGTGALNIPKANTPGTSMAQRYRHSPVYYSTST